ncbi:HAD family hydrolase, partial [Methanococcoides sp. SA1]|nr:HAD family hydrolase [Methanococcoides sp. SA1]
MIKKFKIVGFDADDTLWMNENYYREAEAEFCTLMSDYCSKETAEDIIFKTEIGNLDLYGYGAKGFTLSMIEAARIVSSEQVSQDIIGKILQLGKDLINKPLILLDGIEETLKKLSSENIKL